MNRRDIARSALRGTGSLAAAGRATAGRGGGRGSAAADRVRSDPGRHPAPGARRALGRGPAERPGRAPDLGQRQVSDPQRRIILDERPIPQNAEIGPVASSTRRYRSTDWPRTARSAWPSRRPTSRAATDRDDRYRLSSAQPPPGKPVASAACPPPAPPSCTCWRSAATVRRSSGRRVRRPRRRCAGRLARRHLTSADGTRPQPEQPAVLAGARPPPARSPRPATTFTTLVQNKQVHEHDIVAVVIASHLLASGRLVIAASDTVAGNPPRPAFAAPDLCEVAGPVDRLRLPRRRVPRRRPQAERAAPERDQAIRARLAAQAGRDHVRRLEGRAQRGGSDQAERLLRPGRDAGVRGADLAGVRKDRSAAYTLDQFRTAFGNEVLNLSWDGASRRIVLHPDPGARPDPLRQRRGSDRRAGRGSPARTDGAPDRVPVRPGRPCRVVQRDQGEALPRRPGGEGRGRPCGAGRLARVLGRRIAGPRSRLLPANIPHREDTGDPREHLLGVGVQLIRRDVPSRSKSASRADPGP